jgi:HEAT repeat protein
MEINPQQLAELEQNLRAAGLHHRWIALNEIATYPAEIAVPILNRLLAENDIGLRRLAVMGLGKQKSAAAFDTLQTLIAGGGDPSILAEAADAIFEFGEDRAIPLLQQLFDRSTNWLVRQTIVSVLLETDRSDVLLAVATTAIADATPTVREIGIVGLGKVLQSPLQPAALALLAELATDADWRIRWRTAIALQGCTAPLARQLITKLQQDQDFRVVAAALKGSVE